jgi:hypothetical protein
MENLFFLYLTLSLALSSPLQDSLSNGFVVDFLFLGRGGRRREEPAGGAWRELDYVTFRLCKVV